MSEYKKEDLRKLQLSLLEIFNDVVKICNKHNLTYFLAGGTCLGAVRHKGFIPWDDDIDIIMPRNDYMKFLDIAREELGSKYFLDYDKTSKYYHKYHVTVRKNNTYFGTEGYDKKEKKGIHQGFFVDVLPLDFIPSKDSKKTKVDVVIVRTIEQVIRFKTGYLKFRHLRNKLISLPLIVLPKKLLHSMMYKRCMKYNDKKRNYLVEYCSPHFYKKIIYDYDTVFPASKVIFEGKEYSAFHDTDKYLTQLYGNYMKYPPKEKQVAHKPLILDFNNGMVKNTKEEYDKLNKKK